VSFDKLWFNQEVLDLFTQKFYLEIPSEDPITLQLREEITQLLGCKTVLSRAAADVVLELHSDLWADSADGDAAGNSDTSHSSDNSASSGNSHITAARAEKPCPLMAEGYKISQQGEQVVIAASTSAGLLYGFYAFMRRFVNREDLNFTSVPSQAIRMINHWDQIDGTVERGYAGASIFFGSNTANVDLGTFDLQGGLEADLARGSSGAGVNFFRKDFARLKWYARFLASVGVNALSLNNVNVRGLASALIVPPYIDQVRQIADLFRRFGIKTFLAINWQAPKLIGGLATSDPLDKGVGAWWKKIAAGIYQAIPDFGGFVVKADSEGEPGPYQYGRNHAQGANMLADALAPHGGLVIWRTFVYNSQQDWRDRSLDRAKAAYQNFQPLDGQFKENVVLQIKFGPIDFQTREPLNPLFVGMKKTNQIFEVQITAEYLGQQIDLNYAVPQWHRMLNFDTTQNTAAGSSDSADRGSSNAGATSGNSKSSAAGHPNASLSPLGGSLVRHWLRHNGGIASGMAGVGNVGMDYNWTGNKLAQANLYGFGRLAWDNTLAPQEILQEWITQSFYHARQATHATIGQIMMTSNRTSEKYTAPLGVGFMVKPHYHYGVAVNGYEYDRWGTYHFADRVGVGVDRTTKSGTGFTALYGEALGRIYENIKTVPDEIILFFHHVPYSHVLQNGKTLIQYIYDLHFEGYEAVLEYIKQWETLKGESEARSYQKVAEREELQW
jgi:alpha-glucuronidase